MKAKTQEKVQMQRLLIPTPQRAPGEREEGPSWSMLLFIVLS